MTPALQIILPISFTFFSSISTLTVSPAKPAITDIPPTINTRHAQHQHSRQTQWTDHYPEINTKSTKPIKERFSQPSAVATHIATPINLPKHHDAKVSQLIPRTYHGSSKPPVIDPATAAPNEDFKTWYEADWVTITTWALWLYAVASVLGLLALWGRGVIDRTGAWVINLQQRGGRVGGGGSRRGRRGNGSGWSGGGWRRVS